MYHYNKKGLQELNSLVHKSNYLKIVVITDVNTAKYCLPVLTNEITFKYQSIHIPAGDATKNIETLQYIWKQLLILNADRKSLIINLGGGVVTDIGGFAASTYKRGIDFVHIPTSLLGMIDASIGGKNGINFMQAKNQIGVINLPKMILINDVFLDTLPKNEFDSGFAEMLKHGLIADQLYWNELIDFKKDNQGDLLDLIKKSVTIKHAIITKDPQEKGVRKALNFGHTLGHAIESYLTYSKQQTISHGHAVAIGMVLASYISHKQLSLPLTTVNDIKKNLLHIFSTIPFNKTEIDTIIELLKFDKKNENGEILFVLLKNIGEPVYNEVVSHSILLEAFDYYLS